MKQVDKSHYNFGKYAHLDRFSSYFYQLKEIYLSGLRSILEIGVGDRVIGGYLKANSEIAYTGMDIDPELKPDIVGDILKLPFKDASFDAVCAFEVLEHIPFESFDKAVSEMARVAKLRVLISLPHFGPPIKFLIKLPFIPEIKFAWKAPYHPKHQWNGEHYWELGKKGYTAGAIIKVLEKHGKVIRDYVPFENQYHHFFILDKDPK